MPFSPNPFNSSTLISIRASDTGPCRLEIYDMLGRLVKSETISDNSSGKWSYRWDGADDGRVPLPSGLYFVRARNETVAASAKVILLK